MHFNSVFLFTFLCVLIFYTYFMLWCNISRQGNKGKSTVLFEFIEVLCLVTNCLLEVLCYSALELFGTCSEKQNK